MPRFSRPAVLLASAALLIVAAPAASPASNGPSASAARTCSVGDSQSYGTTYVIWIKARNVGCRRARKLVRQFHACRPGPKGHCRHVKGYKCSENRTYGRGSFDSVVRCKNGGKVVRHQYTQWT